MRCFGPLTETTPTGADLAASPVVLPATPSLGTGSQRWELGPADWTGTDVASARAVANGPGKAKYMVKITLSAAGYLAYGQTVAARAAAGGASDFVEAQRLGATLVVVCTTMPCPTESMVGEEAIVANGKVVTSFILGSPAPTQPQPLYIIGPLTARQARTLAAEIRAGAA